MSYQPRYEIKRFGPRTQLTQEAIQHYLRIGRVLPRDLVRACPAEGTMAALFYSGPGGAGWEPVGVSFPTPRARP